MTFQINHELLKLIRVGSSSLGESIDFHENLKEKNSKTFCLDIFKKITKKQLGFTEELLENKYTNHGIKCEPMVLKIYEMISEKSLSEKTVLECFDPFLGTLSISKPDGVFIERGTDLKIPVEVKTKYPDSEMVSSIPDSHLAQVMFHIMCMDSVNGEKTPYADYLHVRFAHDSTKIQSRSDVFGVRIFRDERMIEEIRERLKILYYNYIFEDRIPDSLLFEGRTMPFPKIIKLKSIFKNFDSVVESLLIGDN